MFLSSWGIFLKLLLGAYYLRSSNWKTFANAQMFQLSRNLDTHRAAGAFRKGGPQTEVGSSLSSDTYT